jgi:dTMP kinase
VSGRLIVLEGGEGVGKSTQAALLAVSLDAVLTREPGGTVLGERIRDLLLDPAADRVDDRAEALLMAAARAQHVAEVVRPALASGRDVVCDRFSGSSLAYQGYGRGLALDEVGALSGWATGGLWPDLVILLNLPAGMAASRRRRSGSDPDRLEAEGENFHRRVAEGFRCLAAAEPTWVVVDGAGTVEEVAERVAGAVEAYFASAIPGSRPGDSGGSGGTG